MHDRFSNAIYLIAAYAVFTGASDVFTYEDHGLTGVYWHATGVWESVVVGALWATAAWAAAVWFSRKQKWATHDPR